MITGSDNLVYINFVTNLELVFIGCVLEYHLITLPRRQNSCQGRTVEGGGRGASGGHFQCLPGKAVSHAGGVQYPEAFHIVYLQQKVSPLTADHG